MRLTILEEGVNGAAIATDAEGKLFGGVQTTLSDGEGGVTRAWQKIERYSIEHEDDRVSISF